MKIKTKEEYYERLSEDLAWRKKELSIIRLRVTNAKPSQLDSEIRAGILLLYAHWEGFVKNTTNNFLIYIKFLKLNYSDLSENLLALSLKSRIHEFESTFDHELHTLFVKFFINDLNQRATWNLNTAIDTKSNLNSDVLKNILSVVGIPFSDFELKANLIDEQLLKNRNTIAHGRFLNIDKIEYLSIHTDIIKLLDILFNHLTNLVVLKQYKKVPSKI